MKNPFKKIKETVKGWFVDQANLNKFKEACEIADQKRITNGRKQYVMFVGGEYLVIDNQARKALNKRLSKRQRIDFQYMEDKCYYKSVGSRKPNEREV